MNAGSRGEKAANTEPPEDGEGPSRSTAAVPPLTRVFDALSTARSRHVLYVLSEASANAVPLDELVAAVGARESGADAPAEAALAEIRSTLHHAHLPKLADLGLLGYKPSARTVTPTEEMDRLEPYLSFSRRVDER